MTTVDDEARHLVSLIRRQFGLTDLPLHIGRQLLTAGEPVTVDQVATAGGWTIEQLSTELRKHPGVDWTDDGRIAGFGLTLRPTPHSFTTDGRTVYAFCASDALEFPVMLGRSGVIESACPATGRRIRIEVDPDHVVAVTPASTVVSKIRPDQAVDDIRRQLCDLGNFFIDAEAAGTWTTQHPEGHVVPIDHEFAVTVQAMSELGWTAPTP
ncbi:organomercurial lyase MerB [Jiangella alkaliphila]|uniref:Alkylmercury lyase n=1 Tax=Jiangella alkaliphila TaxID=419479 RepID=A0A1H2L7Z9_9ACTN|nr:organomercurial lyase MerB [Jiangella alkaliphila]SDU76576.1 alkylmercury lyase [Jiangella alkaliphila]